MTFKMKVKTLMIWMKIGRRTDLVNVHICVQKLALLGPAVCSQYNHDLDESFPANVPCQKYLYTQEIYIYIYI